MKRRFINSPIIVITVLLFGYCLNAQKSLPFYMYIQSPQTIETNNLAQKIDFSGQGDVSDSNIASHHKQTNQFIIDKEGTYKVQTGIAFNPQLIKNLPATKTIALVLQIVDQEQRILESVSYMVPRYAIPETVYIQTAKSSYYFSANSTFSIHLTIRKGIKELGKGPHILSNETVPFSKFISIEKL